jgi:DNA-directed RNA polymerase I subunit RPA43
LLVFRPAVGATLSGWINVASDTFVGLVVYNYFQAGVTRPRIPKDWRWVGPGGSGGGGGGRSRRVKRTQVRMRSGSSEGEEEEEDGSAVDAGSTTPTPAMQGDPQTADGEDDGAGYFVRADGSRVAGTMQFRVVDADVVPGHDREKWALQIQGTLLSPEDEARLVEEEKVQAEKVDARGRPPVRPTGTPSRDLATTRGAFAG